MKVISPGDGYLYAYSVKSAGTADYNFLVWFNPTDGAVL